MSIRESRPSLRGLSGVRALTLTNTSRLTRAGKRDTYPHKKRANGTIDDKAVNSSLSLRGNSRERGGGGGRGGALRAWILMRVNIWPLRDRSQLRAYQILGTCPYATSHFLPPVCTYFGPLAYCRRLVFAPIRLTSYEAFFGHFAAGFVGVVGTFVFAVVLSPKIRYAFKNFDTVESDGLWKEFEMHGGGVLFRFVKISLIWRFLL